MLQLSFVGIKMVFVIFTTTFPKRANIGHVHSSRLPITCGVPQGSVLGPLLFLLYINDLPLNVKHSNLSLFADDATLYQSSGSVENVSTHLSSDVENINTWCYENYMTINET